MGGALPKENPLTHGVNPGTSGNSGNFGRRRELPGNRRISGNSGKIPVSFRDFPQKFPGFPRKFPDFPEISGIPGSSRIYPVSQGISPREFTPQERGSLEGGWAPGGS